MPEGERGACDQISEEPAGFGGVEDRLRSDPARYTIGAIGALMNRVLQPHPLLVLGLNVWMGTAAGADGLVEIPTDARKNERGEQMMLASGPSGRP